jgi:hypothetical protein
MRSQITALENEMKAEAFERAEEEQMVKEAQEALQKEAAKE